MKGSAHCDWGMKNRLGKMFDPRSGNTVMLAFDHGYIMGPTAGLERIDLVIPPLIPHVNVLMGTRGMIRSCISPAAPVAKCVRVTYDSTVLYDDMSNGCLLYTSSMTLKHLSVWERTAWGPADWQSRQKRKR